MTLTKNLPAQPIDNSLLVKRILFGAGIALIIISFFLLSVKHPRPEWGKFWMIRPLIVTPLIGALGGACTYIVSKILNGGGWKTALAITLNVLGYTVSLWIGTILGLVGTLWN